MASSPNVKPSAQEVLQQSSGGCFLRLCWMVFGNIGLLLTAKKIADYRGSVFSVADAVYATIIVVMISIRYFDISRCHGQTATGAPATLRHWIRYTILMLIGTMLVWAAAHSWAYWHR